MAIAFAVQIHIQQRVFVAFLATPRYYEGRSLLFYFLATQLIPSIQRAPDKEAKTDFPSVCLFRLFNRFLEPQFPWPTPFLARVSLLSHAFAQEPNRHC